MNAGAGEMSLESHKAVTEACTAEMPNNVYVFFKSVAVAVRKSMHEYLFYFIYLKKM